VIWIVPASVLLLVLFVPMAVTFIVGPMLWGVVLRLAVWMWWCARGKNVLLVTSDSPVWSDYIREEILPLVRERAIVLNWSKRLQGSESLARKVHRHFGGHLNFNPMVIVFHPFGRTHVFRYFKAFRAYKHGKPQEVERLTERLRSILCEQGLKQ
jgi:hypothetical protein